MAIKPLFNKYLHLVLNPHRVFGFISVEYPIIIFKGAFVANMQARHYFCVSFFIKLILTEKTVQKYVVKNCIYFG